MLMKPLFDEIRGSLFGGKLIATQVSGIERLIDAWEKFGYGLDTGCSYILAVSYHETGRRMQPVRETYADSTDQAINRLNNAFAKNQMKWVSKPYWNKDRNGKAWFGRGDVQLTHEANYNGAMRDAVKGKFGVDIHADPDLVLRPDISAFVLVEGVTRGVTKRPDFTSSALEDFITPTKTDYANARKTVNPGEKDTYELIAGYARKFEVGIAKGRLAAGEKFTGVRGK